MDCKAVVVFLCVLAGCESVTPEFIPRCDQGDFFNRALHECMPCSTCEDNQVVRRNCFDDQDTLCGPFPGFLPFIIPSSEGNTVPDNFDNTAKVLTTPTEIVAASDDKWFTVTMVLVGILVVTCAAGVIIVLVTCVVCRRKDREIVYEPEFATACTLIRDDGTVDKATVIEQFKLMSERES